MISDMPSQRDRLAVVTGVGGLGYETGLALARTGAEIVMAGRDPVKGQQAVADIRAAVPNASVRFGLLDLASLASVADFAATLLAADVPLDMLVNNAGVMTPPRRRETTDGFELQFGTNYLGHFALTQRLLPLLEKSKAARVVNVSSIAHKRGQISFDDLQAEQHYSPRLTYAQSKLAMLLFAFELDRRAKAGGSRIQSIAAHPGVARTDLFINGPGPGLTSKIVNNLLLPLVSHSAAQGALPLLYAATAPEAQPGGYYGPERFFEMKGPTTNAEVAPQARDKAVAEQLWAISERLTGLPFTFDRATGPVEAVA
ncbi:MAG TPA: SDR family oxidoreductase [Sphingobium sp.]|uniref:SDR family oxidoreductase n=1 Tax=Sphingobium sp. TaxID=1912891 RepID=UPI002ED24A44